MRRLLALLSLTALLILNLMAPGASAETADWELASFNGGEVRIYYTIDINSLQVDSFTTVNNSGCPAYMYITEDGTLIFDMLTPGHTTETQPISGFKFRRIPATDHDDPNSVRYPSGVVMGARWGTCN